jgi:hypothetical protein
MRWKDLMNCRDTGWLSWLKVAEGTAIQRTRYETTKQRISAETAWLST